MAVSAREWGCMPTRHPGREALEHLDELGLCHRSRRKEDTVSMP
jgi:hypothetical protein